MIFFFLILEYVLTLFILGGPHVKTSISGIPIGDGYTGMDKMWNIFAALGNIAFAYAFSVVLIEIQVRYMLFKNYNIQ